MKIFDYFNEELKNYVRIERFTPVEKIVYGGIGVILTAVIVALLGTVLIR